MNILTNSAAIPMLAAALAMGLSITWLHAGESPTTAPADATTVQPLEVGQPAPLFQLPDQDGKPVKLSDFQGQWVVLYFYPKADTPGCTRQACDLRDDLQEFKKLKATVLGVSPDQPAALKAFAEKHKLNFTLLADPEKTVMQRYHAWQVTEINGQKSGRTVRSTVLIKPDGKIAYHWRSVSPAGHAEMVRKKIEELRDKQTP